MKILAFETSCDETSCAVIEDGRKILSNVISTQVPIHKKFGGVVPEIASRHHIEDVLPVAIEALEEARAGWEDIDAVAVTQVGAGGCSFGGRSCSQDGSMGFRKTVNCGEPYGRTYFCQPSPVF